MEIGDFAKKTKKNRQR